MTINIYVLRQVILQKGKWMYLTLEYCYEKIKLAKFFPKIAFATPLIRLRMGAYNGVRNFFRKIWFGLFTCNTYFEIRSFALLPTYRSTYVVILSNSHYITKFHGKFNVFVINLFLSFQ